MSHNVADTSWQQSLGAVLPTLLQQKNESLIHTLLLDTIRRQLTDKIIPKFLEHVENWNEDDDDSADQTLEQAINIIIPFVESSLKELDAIRAHSPQLARRTEQDLQRLWSAALLQFVPRLNHVLRAYLTRHFALVDQLAATHSGDHEQFWHHVTTQHAALVERHTARCRQLHRLNLQAVLEQLATTVLIGEMTARVQRCRQRYDALLHPELLAWFDKAVSAWLDLTLAAEVDAPSDISAACKRRTLSSLYEQFADLRIAELFDMIIEYPDSTPALTDLRECLNKTSKHKELIVVLKQSLTQRLLIPSAETLSIVQCYVRTIKTLLYLDPSALLLSGVSPTLAAYLQQHRPDTLRTIVTQLTQAALSDDPDAAQSDPLLSELQNAETVWKERETEDESSDEDEAQPWHPEPLHIQPGSHREQKPVDILSMLINIYGSRELFVDEYTNMLADRLLAITDFNTDKEIKNMELLKVKFGENSFQRAAIMLRDMLQSKRVNAHIAPKLSSEAIAVPLSATIVSGLFWPQFRVETVVLPESVQRQIEAYSKEFEAHKPSQKLYFKEHLGHVELELEFADGRVIEYAVTPLLATIVLLFQDQPDWTLPDLATKLNLAPELTRRRLAYWLNNGVVVEVEAEHFQLAENGPAEQVQFVEHEDEDVAASGPLVDEWSETYENLIMGMLTNLGEQSLDKIHSTMANFADGYDKTIQQLAAFLDRLVEREKIEHSGNMYSVKQK